MKPNKQDRALLKEIWTENLAKFHSCTQLGTAENWMDSEYIMVAMHLTLIVKAELPQLQYSLDAERKIIKEILPKADEAKMTAWAYKAQAIIEGKFEDRRK